MDIIITLLAAVILLGLIVSIHEGGHFLVARLCGMRVVEFSLGFGKVIYSTHFGKDKTKFTLRWIPFGGFVKQLDQGAVSDEEWNSLSEKEKARSFSQSAKWKKFAMVAGGPLSNFILAFFVYLIAMSFVGTQASTPVISEISPQGVFSNTTLKVGDKVTHINGEKVNYLTEAFPILINSMVKGEIVNFNTQNAKYDLDFTKVDISKLNSGDMGKLMGFYFAGTQGDVLIKKVSSDSVAEQFGLKTGDIVRSINGETMTDMNKVIRRIQAAPGENMVMVVSRNGQDLPITLNPEAKTENGIVVGKIGAGFEVINTTNTEKMRYGVVEGIGKSYHKVVDGTYTTLLNVKKMMIGEISPRAMSGPLAIADYAGKAAQRGLYFYLLMIGVISISVGVSNLLPIPALDGAHLIQYAIEAVFQRDVPLKVVQYLQYLGIGILVSIFTFAFLNDLIKYLV